ncbi:hypothetical protein AAHA92_21786 [Salvia divinorum]|uniref:Uncharacterized protein n=1 Tax=Salvia divinorum TaxID=28513 RepID=A0ABD1GLK6_SALDI
MAVPGAVEIVEHPQPLHAVEIVEIKATPSPSASPLTAWAKRPRLEVNLAASRREADLAAMCGIKIPLLCQRRPT